jgi:hypothetical protein
VVGFDFGAVGGDSTSSLRFAWCVRGGMHADAY